MTNRAILNSSQKHYNFNIHGATQYIIRLWKRSLDPNIWNYIKAKQSLFLYFMLTALQCRFTISCPLGSNFGSSNCFCNNTPYISSPLLSSCRLINSMVIGIKGSNQRDKNISNVFHIVYGEFVNQVFTPVDVGYRINNERINFWWCYCVHKMELCRQGKK